MSSSVSTDSTIPYRRKSENSSPVGETKSKKVRLEDKMNFGGQWSDEYIEGDSILCELAVDENFDNLKSSNDDFDINDDFDNNDDYVNHFDDLQCTQKFIDDISENIRVEKQKTDFDFSKYICGSQYHTREDIKNRTILNKTLFELCGFDQSMKDTLWSSEIFNESSSHFLKGPFYGLPETVEKLIFKHKGITDLYEWQKECLTLPAIEERRNLLYALPTSGGKTLVAEILMLKEMLCREKNVIFILPYVSIVQEKAGSMAPFALNFDFIVEEYAAGKGRCPPTKFRKRRALYIASIEKGAVLFDSLIEANRANEIGLIVVDELHLIGEKGRGAVLESLLAKVMFLKAGIQIVGMSATIGNLPELSDFLNADVYTRGFRPVELKEFIKCGNDILQVNSREGSIDDIFTFCRSVDFKYSGTSAKIDPDHIAGLISEVIPNESCLIFCPTRKNCENVAILLTKILSRNEFIEHKKDEKMQLMAAFEKLCGTLSSVLRETIPFGVAYHHSGLTTDERKLLESAYRFGTISVICCTSTLAAGVNLPAKRVIIRAPYVGSQFITLCQYKQMSGRAGRAGMGSDAGESILICQSKDNYQVGQMLFSSMDKVISSMDYQDAIGLQSFILSAIGLNLANCLRDVLELTSQTLLSVQSKELGVSINALVTSIIRSMFKHKILKISTNNIKNKINMNDIVTTQEIQNNEIIDQQQQQEHHHQHQSQQQNTTKVLVLSKSTKFELTNIGKAAFKAGIDYKRTQFMYDELKIAQKTLVLSNYVHILYLVASFNINNDFVSPNTTILFDEYTRTDSDIRSVAKIIGVTKVHMIKMVTIHSIKGPVESQLNRLFRAMILNDVINLMPLHEIAIKYEIDRGMIQSFVTQSISAANSIIRLCEQIDEFWCFKTLFERAGYKLDHCCIPELASLLDLPSVKIYRAKQLYNAGFKTIEDIAKTTAKVLVGSIEHMSYRTAKEIISAAKIILLKKLEILQEETEVIMNCLHMS